MAATHTQPITSSNEEEQLHLFALQLASASALPMALKSAIELDVLEIIAKAGPGSQLSPSEIASYLPTQNREAPTMLDRILCLLASYSVLTCSVRTHDDGRAERLYGLAPVCKFFIKNQDGVSIAPSALFNLDKVSMESWYHLKSAVLEGGIPFNKAYGVPAFKYLRMDPRVSKLFNKAMSNHSTITMKKILETYKGFEGIKELVDVGGGTGATLNMIMSKYPHIKGTNFDLPQAVEDAPNYPGVKHVAGDMFVSIPSGEAILMKWILHDWSDEHCAKILKNCYKALPDFGKVIIVELILPVAPEDNFAAHYVFQLDNVMLAQSDGGKERTAKEFEVLAKGAGFAGFSVSSCASGFWIMEFSKKM